MKPPPPGSREEIWLTTRPKDLWSLLRSSWHFWSPPGWPISRLSRWRQTSSVPTLAAGYPGAIWMMITVIVQEAALMKSFTAVRSAEWDWHRFRPFRWVLMCVLTVDVVTRLWTGSSANAAWDPGWSRILSFVRTTVAHLGAPSTRAWWTTTCATALAPARTRQTTLAKTVPWRKPPVAVSLVCVWHPLPSQPFTYLMLVDWWISWVTKIQPLRTKYCN